MSLGDQKGKHPAIFIFFVKQERRVLFEKEGRVWGQQGK